MRGRSTSSPTKAQAARIEAVKLGPCMACMVLVERGHDFGIGLCGWHHRAIPDCAHTAQDMREAYGPSLIDGSRKFRESFGSDDDLLERQNKWLEQGDRCD